MITQLACRRFGVGKPQSKRQLFNNETRYQQSSFISINIGTCHKLDGFMQGEELMKSDSEDDDKNNNGNNSHNNNNKPCRYCA